MALALSLATTSALRSRSPTTARQAVVTSIYGDGDDSGEGQVTFDAGNINVFGVTLPDDPDDDDDLY